MSAKQSITLLIVLLWSTMTFLLIKRQIGAPPPLIALRGTEKISEGIEEWWGVYYRGEKIGYAAQTITPRPDGYALYSQSLLQLNLLGTVQPVLTRVHLEANEDWILEKFDFALHSNQVRFGARGARTENRLSLEVESAGHKSAHEIGLTQAPYLLAALKPHVVTQQLETGTRLLFPVFDPATLSQQVATVVIEGREQIRIAGRLEPAIKLRQSFRGVSVVSWVDGHGRTLKEESGTGLSMLRQSAEEAKTVARRGMSLDMVAQTAIPMAQPIAGAADRREIRFRLSGVNLAGFSLHGGRQRLSGDRLEIRREDVQPAAVPLLPVTDARLEPYLRPTAFVQSDHPRIRALSAQIVGRETDALRAALKIKDWIYREIAKEPTVSIPNALEVLEVRKGDCNEHTVLFNALARASGIPAKTVVGVVYLRGAFYYHAWSEIWLGSWVSLDPVLNQFPADVTHIKFLEGEIDRQIDIVQLIGNLKIEVL